MSVRVLDGDCRAVLATLPEQSVQMCVTSPPYFGLRDYGVAGQIGLEATPDAYVAELVSVFRAVWRVLRDDGVLFLNLGDSYWRDPAKGGSGTPNGRNGRGERYAGGLRGASCGTSGKAPEDSLASDCLCGSLCGACRAAYQTGKSHSGGLLAPTRVVSPFEPIQESREFGRVHSPTSDSVPPAIHSADASPDFARTPALDSALPLDALASTTRESDPRLPGGSRQLGSLSACQMCARSFARSAPGSDDTPGCTCGIDSLAGASGRCTSGTLSSDSAYPNLTSASLKPKDLIGIPWRVAFALQTDGWYLRSDIIWHKPNPMPESVTDRPTKSHEYLFLLAKSERYVYNADAIAEPAEQPQGERCQTGQHRTKLTGRHSGTLGSNNGPSTRNRRSVWTVATQPYSGAHFATFPPALIEPCILAGSSAKACESCGAPWRGRYERDAAPREVAPSSLDRYGTGDVGVHRKIGGQYQQWLNENPKSLRGHDPTCACETNTGSGRSLVLDPFGGAGTTGLVADRLGRDAVLIELNPAYAKMARDRIADDNPMFVEVV